MMRSQLHGPMRIVMIVVIAVLVATLLGFVVMWLWNWLMPPLFGLHAINYWQALGLFVLSKLLLGGFRGGPFRGRDWRARMIRRWEDMTPEEREKFSAAMRGRRGPFAPPESAPTASAPKE